MELLIEPLQTKEILYVLLVLLLSNLYHQAQSTPSLVNSVAASAATTFPQSISPQPLTHFANNTPDVQVGYHPLFWQGLVAFHLDRTPFTGFLETDWTPPIQMLVWELHTLI